MKRAVLHEHPDLTVGGKRPWVPPERPGHFWYGKTDTEKQALLDVAGEMIGGTAGALATGPAAPIGAGAGALAGRNLLARPLGRALGLNPEPVSENARTVAESLGIPPEVAQAGETFITNLGAEAGGRAPAVGVRALQNRARTLAQKLFTPSAEAKILGDLAKKYNVPLNLGQATGRNWIKGVEVALDRSSTAMDIVRGGRVKQYKAWEGAVNHWLDQLHAGQISQEEFARLADQSMSQLQGAFNRKVGAAVEATGQRLHPQPVGQAEAGMAVPQGWRENLDTVREWAKGAYGNIRQQYGSAPVDLPATNARAREVLDPLPTAERERFVPAKVLSWLKAGAATETVSSPYTKIAPGLDEPGYVAIGQGTTASQVPPTVPLSEVMEMRTQLLLRQRQMNPKSNSLEIRALDQLIDGMNQDMERSLESNPATGRGYQELRGLNQQYRDFMGKLKAPEVRGKRGNPAVRIIQASEIPERLPAQITDSPTLTKAAITAASPQTTRHIGNVGDDPIPLLRRAAFDEAVRQSTIRNPATGGTRFSPSAFEGSLPAAASELFGTQQAGVSALGRPELVSREQRLFTDPFPRAVGTMDPARIHGEAFPRREPSTATTSLRLFAETRKTPEARRGFLQRLMDKSQRTDIALGDEPLLYPNALGRNIREYGETVPAVLGKPRTQELGEMVQLGTGTIGEGAWKNPSGTSRGQETMSLMRRAVNPLNWIPGLHFKTGGQPSIPEEIFANRTIARKMWDPAFIGKVTSPEAPPPRPLSLPRDVLYGAGARGIMNMARMPKQQWSDEQSLADGESAYPTPSAEDFEPDTAGSVQKKKYPTPTAEDFEP